ncbi:MAG: alpha/beta hydrolase [Lapillicoccus sp.]
MPPAGTVRLVLVHGSRLTHTQWAPQVTRIAALPEAERSRLRVVAPDLPAHGARAAQPFTLDRAVGAVAAAVEDGPADPPVVLVGHSLGGYVAMAYASMYPRRLAGLVLLSCAAVPRGPGAAAYRGVAVLTDRLGPARMTEVNDRVLGRLYPPELVAAVVAGGYWFGPTGAAWREVMARCRPSLLREVTAPVLVAGGVYDQLMVDAARYARAAPHGRVRWVPRAGHLVGFDQPEVVTRMLVEFALDAADGRLDRS